MTVPAGFAVKCFASEPDVVNPIAIDFDHRGRAYVLECLQYPTKGPIGSKGADRIRIYEDTDGDGVADKVTTFAEGLNLATGIAVGHGGVFVGEAPYLLFLQSTKGDDKADKRTVLLDGFGYQDTHETLNSFLWGPDGWLYGCHGVFTHSLVGKPGTPRDKRVPLNAGIWRYHPITQKFEVFAEGTSNPWGYDYNENGSGFLTACVIPHLFHMVPGGLYIRQAGQNFNPYGYGQIREICDHVHYFGASSHEGNIDPRRFTVGGGHAHAGCLIYQGGAYPEKWHGRVFMNNIHGSRINTDILKHNGSTYIGSHGEDFLVANDPNFRVIQLRTGPDGSVYMTDFYDPQICHNTDASIWDRTHGRIYKVVHQGTPQPQVGDLSKLSGADLAQLLKHQNSWWWRQALLVLQERGDRSVAAQLKEMVDKSPDYRVSLRALWAANAIGAFDEAYGITLLDHPQPWVRAWAVRLLAQLEQMLSKPLEEALVGLAGRETSADVRLQIASACQRWEKQDSDCQAIVLALIAGHDDSRDPVLPLMTWLAFQGSERRNIAKTLPVVTAMAGSDKPFVRDFLAPRAFRLAVSTAKPAVLPLVYQELLDFTDAQACRRSLEGILEALRGRRVPVPSSWSEILDGLTKKFHDDLQLKRRLQELGIHFGDKDAVAAMEQEAVNPSLGLERRLEAVRELELARLPSSVAPLLSLATGNVPDELRRDALRALAAFDSEEVPAATLAAWQNLPADLRKEIVLVLVSRKTWAGKLIDALHGGSVERKDLSENDVRRILAFKDRALTDKVEKTWGKLRDQTPGKVEDQLRKFRQQLADLPADRVAGRAVFEKNCMICHRLFGKGNDVGPDLTGANRRDPEYLLINIIDPNRVVGKDYYRAVVFDKSGRLHTGLLAENTPQRLVLKSENSKLTVIPRSEIDDFKIEEKSLMPEGLPETMTEAQFRDLIAYLLEEPFLTRGLIAGPFKMALNNAGPIETAADPLHTDRVVWKPFELGPAGTIDMEKLKVLAPPTDSTAYVYFEINSPRDMKTSLEVAAHEDVKAWLNGKEVLRRMRSFEPQRFSVDLKQGANKLLFKVHNIYGPSWLRARIADPQRAFELSRLKAP
ncbi:MAG TPA: PVC-type heme-binding CxxCH protein [Gemmataceae bacterium]|jgi:putative membrane-bound dehydrogenase-like protein|nr:PVC-type heme-binding CxxCH protein [Gemmataceae bacterium]